MTNTPSDNTTLTSVLAGYEESGFDAAFAPMDDAAVECLTCGTTMPAARFTMLSLRRLEGASDPDDMMAVVAITCPICSAQGVLILGYGPMASARDSDILVVLRDARGEDSLPPDASPSDDDAPTRSEAMRTADTVNGEN
jgi:hypothetical protein